MVRTAVKLSRLMSKVELSQPKIKSSQVRPKVEQSWPRPMGKSSQFELKVKPSRLGPKFS